LKSIKEKVGNYSDDLARKEKEIEGKKNEIKELDKNLDEIKANESQAQILKKKKYVQTSLFEESRKK
jgi:hypothetical protein